MQLSRGLYLNLYGVMRGNKALNLPKGSHSSVRVKKEKKWKNQRSSKVPGKRRRQLGPTSRRVK